MSDSPDQAKEADGPVDRTRRWMRSQGYELEHHTAKAFSEGGFLVEQAVRYEDQQTEKLREIDVIARPPQRLTSPAELHLVIECKKSQHPWVTRRALLPDPRPKWAPTGWRPAVQYLLDIRAIAGGFKLASKPAFDVVQAVPNKGSKDADFAHDAIRQVVGATSSYQHDRPLAICHSVIVLEGDLLSLEFDKNGKEIIQEQSVERVLWKVGAHRLQLPVLVDIVRREALTSYVPAMFSTLTDLDVELDELGKEGLMQYHLQRDRNGPRDAGEAKAKAKAAKAGNAENRPASG